VLELTAVLLQALAAPVDPNGIDVSNAAAAVMNARRASQKAANGHADQDSPISRTTTPHVYNAQLSGYGGEDAQYQGHGLSSFGVSGSSPGRAQSPGDGPKSQDQVMSENAALRTRVSELEVINDFIQRRLTGFEYGSAQDGQENGSDSMAQLRLRLEEKEHTENSLRSQLEESHRRENMMKRRLDEVEAELNLAKEALRPMEKEGAKRPRLSDGANGDETKDDLSADS
jgi:GATA-binding protein, other eukaryote